MTFPRSPHPPPQPGAPLLVRLTRLAILSFVGMALLALTLAMALILLQMTLSERIVPGVSVGAVDISGLTQPQAAAALTERYGALATARYTFRDGDRNWMATAAELGLSVPAEALAERAYAIGHADDARGSLRQQAEAWLSGVALPLTLNFDESKARTYLQRLADEIKRERQDAALTLDGIKVAVRPGRSGRELDVEATMNALSAAVLAQQGETDIALIVKEYPPRHWNVREAAEKLKTALSSPLQLIGSLPNGDMLAPWILTREQILAGLTVTLNGEGDARRYDVSVDLSAFASYLKTLSPNLSKPSAEGRFDFDEASGQLNPITPATEGRRLDVAETIRRLEAAVFDPINRRVVMYFETLHPRYPAGVSAAELGIVELVAEATTYFWGSWQNRRSNIALGAGKLHGVIIAPGEEFSFNQHLGTITAEAGYLEGSVILGGATVTGLGGGICQVSTTMFRAAFSGGYAITERNSHGYRVGYYEYAGAGPGLDAAIWQPDIDLRFLNNSPHHLLIESSFLGAQDALQFRIYSSPHWHVEVTAPIIRDTVSAPPEKYIEAEDLALGQTRQIDYSADGADVVVYRNIYDRSGNLIQREQLFTHYSPWQAVFEVAPGDPRLPTEDEDEDAETEEDDGIAPVGLAG